MGLVAICEIHTASKTIGIEGAYNDADHFTAPLKIPNGGNHGMASEGENPLRTGKEDIKQFQYQAGGIMATTIKIDYALCEGCKMCYEICPTDVFGFNDANRLPTVDYPEECWYCGACIFDCPADGAIHLELPMPCL